MAQVSFSQVSFGGNTSSNSRSNVGFFSLKNDGDEAIVRFMCNSTEDFDILTTHPVAVEGARYGRRVSCIRDAREPLDNCPLCKNGTKVEQKFYIHLIQYERDAQGRITPSAKVWERSVAYAQTLKSYIDNYGPLSDIICKIIRHGRAGDMKTTYEIVPNLNKQIYTDEIYVKDTSLFEGYHALGTVVLDKSYDELSQYVMTGAFPAKQSAQNTAPAPAPQYVAPTPAPAPAPAPVQPTYQTPVAPTQAPVGDTPFDTPFDRAPWNAPSTNGAVQRPTRYY